MEKKYTLNELSDIIELIRETELIKESEQNNPNKKRKSTPVTKPDIKRTVYTLRELSLV